MCKYHQVLSVKSSSTPLQTPQNETYVLYDFFNLTIQLSGTVQTSV